MFCLPYTPSLLRCDGLRSQAVSVAPHGTGRGATSPDTMTTNHTLLDLRQQIHPGIPPQRLQIHDDGAGPPAVQ